MGGPTIAERICVACIQLNGPVEACDCLVVAAEGRERTAAIVVDRGGAGEKRDGAVVACERVVESRQGGKDVSPVVPSFRVLWLQRNRAIVGSKRVLQAVHAEQGAAAVVVKRAVVRIEFDGERELPLRPFEFVSL